MGSCRHPVLPEKYSIDCSFKLSKLAQFVSAVPGIREKFVQWKAREPTSGHSGILACAIAFGSSSHFTALRYWPSSRLGIEEEKCRLLFSTGPALWNTLISYSTGSVVFDGHFSCRWPCPHINWVSQCMNCWRSRGSALLLSSLRLPLYRDPGSCCSCSCRFRRLRRLDCRIPGPQNI